MGLTDGLADLLAPFDEHPRAWEAGLWGLIAAGATLALAAILVPQWPLLLLLDLVPGLVMSTVTGLEVRPRTAVALYGLALTLAAGLLFWAFERRMGGGSEAQRRLRRRMRVRFLALVSFVVGFVGARAVVVLGGLANTEELDQAGLLPFEQIWLFGHHIHHFFLGFLLLAVVGWLAVFGEQVRQEVLAVLYGLGMGIFVDEFGFLLTWGDYYAYQTWFVATLFLSILMAGIAWTWGSGTRTGPDRADPT